VSKNNTGSLPLRGILPVIKDGPFLSTDHNLSCVGGSWLAFAWHTQNSKRFTGILTITKQKI